MLRTYDHHHHPLFLSLGRVQNYSLLGLLSCAAGFISLCVCFSVLEWPSVPTTAAPQPLETARLGRAARDPESKVLPCRRRAAAASAPSLNEAGQAAFLLPQQRLRRCVDMDPPSPLRVEGRRSLVLSFSLSMAACHRGSVLDSRFHFALEQNRRPSSVAPLPVLRIADFCQQVDCPGFLGFLYCGYFAHQTRPLDDGTDLTAWKYR